MQNTETNIIPLKFENYENDLNSMWRERPAPGSKRECAGRQYYIGKNGNWVREDGKREAKPKAWRVARGTE